MGGAELPISTAFVRMPIYGAPGARLVSATPVDWGLAPALLFACPAATVPVGRGFLVLFVSAVGVGGVTL